METRERPDSFALLGASYLDLGGLRSALSATVIVAVATVVAALVLVVAVFRVSRSPAR